MKPFLVSRLTHLNLSWEQYFFLPYAWDPGTYLQLALYSRWHVPAASVALWLFANNETACNGTIKRIWIFFRRFCVNSHTAVVSRRRYFKTEPFLCKRINQNIILREGYYASSGHFLFSQNTLVQHPTWPPVTFIESHKTSMRNNPAQSETQNFALNVFQMEAASTKNVLGLTQSIVRFQLFRI